jgi:hypothetical protein
MDETVARGRGDGLAQRGRQALGFAEALKLRVQHGDEPGLVGGKVGIRFCHDPSG